MSDLLPCPFCGDRMENRDGIIAHREQGACIIGQNAYDEGNTARWNTRAAFIAARDITLKELDHE